MNRKTLFSFLFLVLFSGAVAVAQGAPTAPPPPDGQGAEMYRRPSDSGKSRMMSRDHSDMRGGMPLGPPGMWWKNADLAQKIGLTADQQKRMDDIFQQSRLQLIDLKANVEKQEIMMEPMLAANPPDTNKVLAQIDRVAQARAELEKGNAKMLLGIRGVLSADQWTKLQAERKSFMMRGSDGPGGSRGFRGPDGPRVVPDEPSEK